MTGDGGKLLIAKDERAFVVYRPRPEADMEPISVIRRSIRTRSTFSGGQHLITNTLF